jgi:hypothetical protein
MRLFAASLYDRYAARGHARRSSGCWDLPASAASRNVPLATRLRAGLAQCCTAMVFVLGLATIAQAGQLRFAWARSPSADVIGYVVLYGVVPGEYTRSLDVGNQTSATVYGLAGGQSYYFAVVAYSALTFSPPSNVITGTTTNLPPQLTTPGDQQSPEGTSIRLQLVASDPDGDPLAYSASGLPDGLTLDGVSGLISGTVAFSALGRYPVTISVNDGSVSTSVTFNWVVTFTDRPPTFTSTPNRSNPVNAVITFQLSAVDPEGDRVVFGATGLPPTVSLDPATGIIAGKLTTAGSYSVTVSARDTAGLTASQSFVWTVLAADTPPTLTAPGNQLNSLKNPIELDLVASDPDGNTLTYSAAGLPPGLVLDSATGDIAGQPTTVGVYSVTVTVSDGLTPATTTFGWTIIADFPPTFTNPGDQRSLQGRPLFIDLNWNDLDGDLLTASATGLPPGLIVNATKGTIGGTPTAQGTYSAVVSVSDGTISVSQTFTWTIVPNSPPVLTVVGNLSTTTGAAVALPLTASDPDGDVVTFSAIGGAVHRYADRAHLRHAYQRRHLHGDRHGLRRDVVE